MSYGAVGHKTQVSLDRVAFNTIYRDAYIIQVDRNVTLCTKIE